MFRLSLNLSLLGYKLIRAFLSLLNRDYLGHPYIVIFNNYYLGKAFSRGRE